MIAVIALNPALDITHHVPGVDWAGVNRPDGVRAVPGGKGVNVARTLHALGTDVLLTGLAGGSSGEELRAALEAAGIPVAFTPIAAATRRTFAVVDTTRDDVALFNEPGPQVSPAEYEQFLARYGEVLADAAAVVLSGSLPSGLAHDSYAELIRLAMEAGVPALLDTSGAALLPAAKAGPLLVKPNLDELSAALGRAVPAPATAESAIIEAALELKGHGPEAVVVSLAADGLLAVTGEGSWRVTHHAVSGNSTGAGDAAVAGLAYALATGHSWADRLRHAAALGAAAAAAPAAGEFRHDDYLTALEVVEVFELDSA